ncbi:MULTISPECIES: hypothetical protein [unclassified Algoriphagus]|jgi:hypothetical protein|uniref:hypothetical protein n=1 Tax=unclassified Algoriphagus TaxID=2641541 RepID=UPI000EC7C8E6|nr:MULTISPECIES: hypothetical protein [unclassified Algoriphagus]QYH41002.1 hypothetical protein GYM62_20160 [Algoriphagus sp. NBT04N3]HAD51557.1 hypothetical protein [Algoriphagus sp.]HCB46273.1 hypothetical protein [Algoriphagus sp.]HCH45756.1 hypothetical protein [Algoriphagus sp.]|tara:strand:+ start:10161 stop:11108 length:948 start_codon:yes stop_codon:yes gene_type:complete
MKMIKYSFGLLMGALIFLSSCRDFVEPNIPYSDFDTAAYLRTISRTSTTFNFFDLANSKFALTLEAVDAEDGNTVETVEIRVRHRRLIPGVGLEYTPANDVLVRTLQKSDFAPNSESRFLRVSFEIPASEAISAVGLTPAQIEGADVFEFRLVLNDKFGRRFSSDNVTTNVAGAPFYASPFQYNVSVICPSDLGGTYNFTQTNMQSIYGSCPGTISGTTTFTPIASTPGAYRITDGTFGFWNCYGDSWGSGNVRINDACGKLTMSGSDKYSASYSMTVVSVNAQDLVIQWLNSDGETGLVTIKSNSGKPWPAGLR